MEQTAPKYTPLRATGSGLSLEQVSSSLTLSPSDLIHEPIVVNTGNNFLLVPLKDADVLKNLNPDLAAISRISEPLDLIGFYPFSTQTFVSGSAGMLFVRLHGGETTANDHRTGFPDESSLAQ